jgi:predicted methyltransferase
MPYVLSHYQATPLLDARRTGATAATTSLDLGLSAVEVAVLTEGVRLPDGGLLTWEQVEAIAASATACFLVEGGAIRPIQVFSEHTNWSRTLMPTEGAPTTLVSGVLMHRVKGTDPYHDTLSKMRAVAPVRGRVLDTATGLGYTAIEAAKTAERVVTIDLDPAALAIARLNPWSRALFENPVIEQRVGDAFEIVQTLDDGAFDIVIHDPPAFSLAGDLYSGAFYRHLARVLDRRGRLFHYIGDLDSASGRRVTPGVMRRLKEAGFARVVRRPGAFGLVAWKQ